MLDGVILVWFVLAALGVVFVAIDVRSAPESPVCSTSVFWSPIRPASSVIY